MSSQTLYRSGAFMGLFADSHLGDTELEGGVTALAMKGVSQALDRISGSGGDAPALQAVLLPPSPTPASLEQLRVFSKALALGASLDGGDLEANVAGLLASLSSLHVGEYALPNGGWSKADGGHAIMHCVIRERDAVTSSGSGAGSAMQHLALRRFTFVTINTGLGINYHDNRSGDGARAKRQCVQDLALGGVPGWRLLDPAFLYLLVSTRCHPQDSNGPDVVYRVLLPWLAGDAPASALATAAVLQRVGPWATPQRAGFCFARCVFAALRYVAARVWRWEEGAVKRLMLAHRLAWLVPSAREAARAADDPGQQASPLSVSDLLGVLLAARQCARALGKALAKGQLPSASFDAGQELVNQSLGLLRAASRRAGLPVPGLDLISGAPLASSLAEPLVLAVDAATLANTSCFLPSASAHWPRLELAACLGGAESRPLQRSLDDALAGPQIEAPVQFELTLALQARAHGRAEPWTALQVVQALDASLHNCMLLRNCDGETAGSAMQYLVVGTVEALVLETLPLPDVERGWADWSNPPPRGLTPALQAQALASVLALMKQYCAARASLPPRQGGTFLASLTLAALSALLDALARLPCTAADGSRLPLSMALCGEAGKKAPLGFELPPGLASPPGLSLIHI